MNSIAECLFTVLIEGQIFVWSGLGISCHASPPLTILICSLQVWSRLSGDCHGGIAGGPLTFTRRVTAATHIEDTYGSST